MPLMDRAESFCYHLNFISTKDSVLVRDRGRGLSSFCLALDPQVFNFKFENIHRRYTTKRNRLKVHSL